VTSFFVVCLEESRLIKDVSHKQQQPIKRILNGEGHKRDEFCMSVISRECLMETQRRFVCFFLCYIAFQGMIVKVSWLETVFV
jgi:hypothetical protein